MKKKPDLTSVILLTLAFLNYLNCFSQDNNSLVKFQNVKTWEQSESPSDIRYKIVENWIKLPDSIQHKVVTGVAVDSKDRIYILDRGVEFPSVICVNTNGEFLFQWKTKGIGEPHLITCDKNDDMWITDIVNHQIYKLSKEGEIIFSLGEKGVIGSDAAHYNKPTDIEFLKDGNCLISDGYGENKRVIKYNSQFKYLSEWGKKGNLPGEFLVPHALTLGTDGLIYVADRDAWRVQVFNQDGKLQQVWPHIGYIFDLVETPDHTFLCLDGKNGRMTEVDAKGNVIGFVKGDKYLRGHSISITSKGDAILALKDGRIEMVSKNVKKQ